MAIVSAQEIDQEGFGVKRHYIIYNVKEVEMKSFLIVAMLCMTSIVLADVTISNIKVEMASPWGKAYITYDVGGCLPVGADQSRLVVRMNDCVTHTSISARAESLSGDKALTSGRHRIVWNLERDNISRSAGLATFTVAYYPLYLVVDLVGGMAASTFPVSHLSEVPIGGWTEEYKTTKLVLRRIDEGAFVMGKDQSDQSHCVTLTDVFYIGVFEVTQRQWELVMGNNPSLFSHNAQRPVECVSYEMIRGDKRGSAWPDSLEVDANSFFGVLRGKTGIEFDLPTEAQWEYACRAGTKTKWSYGEDANGDYMWYTENSGGTTHDVGVKIPNGWGLYDMYGNVCEWCLDWAGAITYGTDPKGSHWASDRVRRGGSFSDHFIFGNTDRNNYIVGNGMSAAHNYGFRISRIIKIGK